jgi:nitronate monooxygenase
MSVTTRLTERLGLLHPIISAPMAFAAGWKLASAVSSAGGLGLVGGGYGDETWLREQLAHLDGKTFGCGFIAWSLRKQPHLLDIVLEHKPKAILLSFGDPEPFVERVKKGGALLICQVQTRRDAARAVECGADIVVAQGAEAGGHGDRRATMTLVPEIADLIAAQSPDTLLCAAGGIADGRGIAAALMLGADGVMIGSRLWASNEANVSTRMHDAALRATGDDTIRTSVMDVARKLEWPNRYTARVLKNEFTNRWHGREDELRTVADEEAPKYRKAWAEGDPEKSNTFVGEVAGLLHRIEPVQDIVARLMRETESRLAAY